MSEDVQNQDEQEESGVAMSQYPCGDCGASLEFKPGADSLTCPYCQSVTAIENSGEAVEEKDYRDVLRALESAEATTEVLVVQCQTCAATIDKPEHITSLDCPYCGSAIVLSDKSESRIQPKSLLPFDVGSNKALELFKEWIQSRWFAPNALKQYARVDQKLQGLYVPHWTYDSNTRTRYHGQRGDNYTVTRKGSDGKTRTETKTRWHSVSGTVYVSFDDVLVLGSRSLPQKYAEALEPWDLQNLVPYSDDYLAGFSCEQYQVDVEGGFGRAKELMKPTIERKIEYDIGGDKQRISSMSSVYNDITFKHILLPVWMCAYRYEGEVYRFLINARTGEVQGERPWSWIKIALATIVVLAIIGGIIWMVQQG